jgi:glycosyltransferase involved in cell wall biosynthesis
MTGLPKVSVIIPAYDSRSTILETLLSVKNQDYQGSVEIIVVDDGSTDGTPEIADRHSTKVIRQSNKGPGVARNRGVQEASGDILVFTDSDCVLSPGFVSEVIKSFQDGNVSGVQGKYECHDRSVIARFVQHEYEERARRQAKVDNVYWVATHSACYRRDAFFQVSGFYEDTFSRGEDLELSQRMADQGLKIVFNGNAIVYHHHPSTLRQYISAKYARAYWMIWLYKKFPNRVISDPITPVLRKLMMIFLAIGVVSIPIGIAWSPFLYVLAASWLLLLLSTVPFSARVFVKDPLVGLVAPGMMIIRTAVFLAGFATGIWTYLWKRRFDPVSY